MALHDLYGQFDKWELHKFKFRDLDPKNFYLSVECCDIDMDGDLDLFTGGWKGYIGFYENTGNPKKFYFQVKQKGSGKNDSFNNISVGNKSMPRFVDIDADGDFDLFIGNNAGNIAFYRNDGSVQNALFKLVRDGMNQMNSYFNINVGIGAAPYFIDIDNDNDFDMFIGNAAGYIAFYKNDGTATSPLYTKIKGGFSLEDSFNNISTDGYAVPIFCDIKNRGIYDLFIGNWTGTIHYYDNTGSEKLPKFKMITKEFGDISVGGDSSPFFTDLNNDRKDEVLIGNNEGEIRLYHRKGEKNLLVFDRNKDKEDVKDQNDPKDQKDDKKDINDKIEKITMDKIHFNNAQELYNKKEYIEALHVINKIDKRVEKVKALEDNCEKGLDKLYESLGQESFLFAEVAGSFKKAVDYYIDMNYEKSIKYFDIVLKDIPNHKVSLIYKKKATENKAKEKDREEALDSFKTAKKFYQKGDIKKAFFTIKEARKLDPENEMYRSTYELYSDEYYLEENKTFYKENLAKANALLELQKYEDAAVILYQLKDKFPKDDEIVKLLEICNKKITNFKVKFNQKMKEKYTAEGDSLYQSHKYSEALEKYQLALKYSPSDNEIQNKINKTRRNQLKKEGRTLDRESVKKYMQQAHKYYTMGKYEEAIAEWEKVLEIDPENKLAKKNIINARKKIEK